MWDFLGSGRWLAGRQQLKCLLSHWFFSITHCILELAAAAACVEQNSIIRCCIETSNCLISSSLAICSTTSTLGMIPIVECVVLALKQVLTPYKL